MEIMKCFINSIISSNGGISKSTRINKFFTQLKKIGEESGYGIALTSSLVNIPDFLIIKSPKSKWDAESLIHECFIGLFGTNLLRKKIPNFAYIYGMMSCTAPILDNSSVINWCKDSNSNNVSYVIYEKINNSISFGEYIDNYFNSIGDFMNIFLQILFSLKIAYEDIGFTHHDLHENNILLREYSISEIFYIKYNNKYLKCSKYIATIIDYGRSNIKYEKLNFGYIDVKGKIFSTNYSDIFIDVYNFTMSTFLSSEKVFQALTPIIQYFHNIEKREDLYDRDPPTILDFNIDNFISYCIQIMEDFNIESPIKNSLLFTDNILQCGENECYSEEAILNYLNINENINIVETNILKIYDLYIMFNTNGEINKINNLKMNLLNNFDNIFMEETLLIDNIKYEMEDSIYFITDFKITNTVNEKYKMLLFNFYEIINFISNLQDCIEKYNIYSKLNIIFNLKDIDLNIFNSYRNLYYYIININEKYTNKIIILLENYKIQIDDLLLDFNISNTLINNINIILSIIKNIKLPTYDF